MTSLHEELARAAAMAGLAPAGAALSRETRCRPLLHLALAVLCLLAFPAVSHAVLISNGISEGTVGHFRVDVLTGGESVAGFVTAQRFSSEDTFTENVLFAYLSFVDLDPGIEGQVVRLSGSDPVQDANNPNIVSSSGSFVGVNGNNILWAATSAIGAGSQVMNTRFTFAAEDGGPLGPFRFLQYLDEDVQTLDNNVFLGVGSASGGTLELFTFENTEVYGVSQSGAFIFGSGLENAVFAGWAAGQFSAMRDRITGGLQLVSVNGVIDDNLPSFTHPQLGPVFGPRDITSVLAWDVDPNGTTAAITTSLGGVPESSFANLALTKTDSPDPVTVGSNLTYTVNVTNNGPRNATGVTVTDPLSSGVSFVSATPSQGSCSGTSTVSCALGSLANGTTATVTIVVIPTSAGALSNTANVTGSPNDLNPDDDSDTETTTVNPPPPPPPPPPLPNAAPVSPNPQLGCTGSTCRVPIKCDAVPGTSCNIAVKIFVPAKTLAVRFGDAPAARARGRLLFAAGVTNIPAGQIANVKLKLRKAGTQIARTSTQLRIRGVMEIRNSAGTVSSTRIRIRLPRIRPPIRSPIPSGSVSGAVDPG